MKKLFWVSFAVAILFHTGLAEATLIIDQNQPNNPLGMATLSQTPVQSFQQTNDNIAGAGIFLTPFDANHPLTGIITIS